MREGDHKNRMGKNTGLWEKLKGARAKENKKVKGENKGADMQIVLRVK